MTAKVPRPKLSVVIPTLGRGTLVQTLESLCAVEDFDALEILVVGAISDNAVRSKIETATTDHSNIRWLPLSFERGDSSEKKNAGFKASRAAIVAFLDDDVRVAKDWPERILEPFEDPAVGLASGPGLVPQDLPFMARLAGTALASKAAGYVAQRYLASDSRPMPVKWSRLIGCNMAYRRAVLEEIGLFDPKFWPGEEMLAAFRATAKGHLLVFHPGAQVYHYPRQTFWRFMRQMFGYGATRIRLIRSGVEFEPTTVVPMAWVLSLALLLPAAAVFRAAAWLLALDVSLYALADIWICADKMRETRRLSDLNLVWLVPLMHLSYGLAEWAELLFPNRDLSEKNAAR
jgi:GT2 family glycosyltransferase